MIDVIKGWFEKHFSDPQAIILVSFLVLGGILVLYWGKILTPVLAGVIIAYVLEGLVKKIHKYGIPRYIAFLVSYALFVAAVALILLGLVPLVFGTLKATFYAMLVSVPLALLTLRDRTE